MIKYKIVCCAALSVCCLLSGCDRTDPEKIEQAYKDGYNKGYEDGYYDGGRDGYDEGYYDAKHGY